MLINPKDITLTGRDGTERRYRIGQIPYLSGGREVCLNFVTTAMPKLGDRKENEDLARKMFAHIAVILEDNTELLLTTDALVNNHVPDFLVGIKLEEAALEHNVGFSVAGKTHEFLRECMDNLPRFITEILTQWQGSLSAKTEQPSKNLEPSTAQKM